MMGTRLMSNERGEVDEREVGVIGPWIRTSPVLVSDQAGLHFMARCEQPSSDRFEGFFASILHCDVSQERRHEWQSSRFDTSMIPSILWEIGSCAVDEGEIT